jgi:hypothetical protein
VDSPKNTLEQLREENERLRQLYDEWRNRMEIKSFVHTSATESLMAELSDFRVKAMDQILKTVGPIPMIIFCPACDTRHIDEGEFATKPHHTHACQSCGVVWRPAVVPTVGVQFLPGFKNDG